MELDEKYVSGKSSGFYRSPRWRRALALEDRVALLPPMHLTTRRTLDRILVLDGQHLERGRIHRKTGVNQLARFWAFDQYAVQPFLISSARTDEAVANKGPLLQGFSSCVAGSFSLSLLRPSWLAERR
jgi:hypothetical protein